MKRYTLLIIMGMALTSCLFEDQVAGTVDEMDTGTLQGVITKDGEAYAHPLFVRLYRTHSEALQKVAASEEPFKEQLSANGVYRFDSLPAGNYIIRAFKDTVLVGLVTDIRLTPHQQLKVNISIVIHQIAFSISAKTPNIAITGIRFNGGVVTNQSNGLYMAEFGIATPDEIEVDLVSAGVPQSVTVKLVEHDGAYHVPVSDTFIEFQVFPDGTIPPDTTGPSVEILWPKGDETVLQDPIVEFSIKATDASGVNPPIIISKNASGTPYLTLTTRIIDSDFFRAVLTLQNSDNEIEILVTDKSPNANETKIIFTQMLDVPSDTTPPIIQLISHNDNNSVSMPTVIIEAEITDISGIRVKSVEIRTNTNSIQVMEAKMGVSNIFLATVNLDPGVNTLEIEAQDGYGNGNTLTFTLNL